MVSSICLLFFAQSFEPFIFFESSRCFFFIFLPFSRQLDQRDQRVINGQRRLTSGLDLVKKRSRRSERHSICLTQTDQVRYPLPRQFLKKANLTFCAHPFRYNRSQRAEGRYAVSRLRSKKSNHISDDRRHRQRRKRLH
jgi:hypothetical protein